jgi:hypothetical protein
MRVRSNPADLLSPLLVIFGALFLGSSLVRASAPGGPGLVATPGTRDLWAPGDPVDGPDPSAVWLALLDGGGQRIYSRAARLFRADASVVPVGEVLFVSPSVAGAIFGAAELARFAYDYVARIGVTNNGDGTVTDQLFGLRIGIDRFYQGVNATPGVV